MGLSSHVRDTTATVHDSLSASRRLKSARSLLDLEDGYYYDYFSPPPPRDNHPSPPSPRAPRLPRPAQRLNPPPAASLPAPPLPQPSITFPAAPLSSQALFIPANVAEITVDGASSRTVNATLWGAYYEESDHAGEGGLYAELLRDRSFDGMAARSSKKFMMSTSLYKSWLALPGTEWSLERSRPLNANNRVYLRATVAAGTPGGGMVNQGFNGIAINAGSQYYVSLWARCAKGRCEALTVSLLSGSTGATYGSLALSAPPANTWQKMTGMLTSSGTDGSAVFAVTFDGFASVDLDVVSLFPGESYLPAAPYLYPFRMDLLLAVTALNPRFLQAEQFLWKNTLGPMEERPGHYVYGSYWSTDGLGIFEFMLLCETIGATPVWVVGSDDTPTNQHVGFDWVQDTLDLMEFVMGGPKTRYGKIRAIMGHAQPWSLTHVVLASADPKCSTYNPYLVDFRTFVTQLKARYPAIDVVTRCRNVRSTYDMYSMLVSTNNPDNLWDLQTIFDDPSLRSLPPTLVSDYAVKAGDGDLRNALAEAAFMMGMERNADVVAMAGFYPLLGSVLDRDHPTMALKFNNTHWFGTPSYYMQQMFSGAQGRVFLGTSLALEDGTAPEYMSATSNCLDDACSSMVVKMLNFNIMPRQTTLIFSHVRGLAPTGELLVLTSANAFDGNSLQLPNLVVPKATTVAVAATTTLLLPPSSLSFLTVTVG